MLTRISFPLACVFVSFFLSIGSFAQQTDRDEYVALYKQGELDKAVVVLKRLTRQNSSDSQAFYFLGMSYLRLEHEKDAVKALEKAKEISPDSAMIRVALAYGYLLRNDKRAWDEAYAGLKLDDKIALGHYVLAVEFLRDGLYDSAYDRAKRAIELDQNLAAAYMIKSQSLVSSFAKQATTVLKPASARGVLLTEAVGDLEKYLSLAPKSNDAVYYAQYLESLRFFAEYYSRPENHRSSIGEPFGSTPTTLNH